MTDNRGVTIQQEAAAALAVVERARSLFGPATSLGTAGAPLQAAAQATMDAGQQMGEQSGRMVDRHATVIGRQNRDLSGAGRTDASLETHLSSAAAVTQGGARRMDAIVARTRSIVELAGTARTPAAEMMVLTALRNQISQTQSVMSSTQQQASEAAGQVRALNYGPGNAPESPAAHDLPTAPPKDPSHGKDPRYWLDVTKIEYVPEGQLAPSGYMEIGPGLWYPDPNRYEVMPPPPPAKYPLDIGDIRVVEPGQLFPPRYQEIAPNIGVPDPGGYVPSQPWGPPQQPIDIRDIVEVPQGQLAPPNYVEYFPGWWVPGPSPSPPSSTPR